MLKATNASEVVFNKDKHKLLRVVLILLQHMSSCPRECLSKTQLRTQVWNTVVVSETCMNFLGLFSDVHNLVTTVFVCVYLSVCLSLYWVNNPQECIVNMFSAAWNCQSERSTPYFREDQRKIWVYCFISHWHKAFESSVFRSLDLEHHYLSGKC